MGFSGKRYNLSTDENIERANAVLSLEDKDGLCLFTCDHFLPDEQEHKGKKIMLGIVN